MLSFIVPVYKPKLAVLDRCIKALGAQSLKDWEAVFVFDGPAPEVYGLFKTYASLPIKFIEIEHGGAPRARNEGFKHTKGDYVVFWDHDCYIEPGTAKMWIDLLEKHKELGIVYSGYKFVDNSFALESNEWDPWRLRIRNYISGCFPTRRELVCKWDESLLSLQDWDYWLSVTEKAKEKGYDLNKFGRYLKGYGFATELPTGDSISARGCTEENWLLRMDAVRRNHAIEERQVCVSSLAYEHEGIRLAKLINADYQEFPNDKPHRYTTIIQVGFSLANNVAEKHASIFQDSGIKKVIFWTSDNIMELWRQTSLENLIAYRELLKDVKQFVEDKKAQEMMDKAGFATEILPMPFSDATEDYDLPKEEVWAVSCSADYGQTMGVLEQSLPDFKLIPLSGSLKLSEIKGLLHFYADATLTNTIKRCHLAGRHVISNVQQPYCGYVSDKETPHILLKGAVEKIRSLREEGLNKKAKKYYTDLLNPKKLLEVL